MSWVEMNDDPKPISCPFCNYLFNIPGHVVIRQLWCEQCGKSLWLVKVEGCIATVPDCSHSRTVIKQLKSNFDSKTESATSQVDWASQHSIDAAWKNLPSLEKVEYVMLVEEALESDGELP